MSGKVTERLRAVVLVLPRNLCLACASLSLLPLSIIDTSGAQASIRSSSVSTFSPPAMQRASQEAITALERDVTLERELSGAEAHVYAINLSANLYTSVIVEQRGIDIVVQVLGPDDKLIADFDDEIRNQGEEKIELVAQAAGNYKLSVKAKLFSAPAGHYTVRVSERRAATHGDRSLQEARELATQFVRRHNAGKYDEARPLIERALAIAESVLGRDDVYVARLIARLGSSYRAKVDHARAKPLYERALAILEKEFGPEHPHVALVTNQLGITYLGMNEIAKADKLLNRAFEVSEKTLGPEHPQVALCLLSLGQLHDDRGDTLKAEQLYLRALTIREKTLPTEELLLSDVLNNLGVLYLGRRDYERAAPFFQRSLTIDEKILGPEHFSLANVLQNLGIVARDRKDYSLAEKYYLRALAIREKGVGSEHPDVAANLNNIANLYRAKGDYARSLEIHLRAHKILEKTVGPKQTLTVLSLGNIAKTYAAMGDIAHAIKFQARADAAIETAIALNMAIGSERQKLAFLDTVAQRTERTISLNMQLAPGDPEASALAILVLLQRKGRVLDATADTLAAVRQHSDARDQALLDQLNEITAQLARLVLNGPQKVPPQEHQQMIKDLEEKKEQLEAEISRRSAEFRAASQPVSLEAVRTAIPDHAALVEFAAYRTFDPKAESNYEAYGETRYVAYVVRRQGEVQGKDLGDAKTIDAAINALGEALRDPRRADARERARAADEKVMQPVRELIGDATQLLISPDGALNLIPFEALVDEQGRYLVERYAFSYLTSGRDLLRLRVARESKSAPLVVADPLFGEPEFTEAAKTALAPQAKISARTRKRQTVITGRDFSSIYFASLGATAQEAQSIRNLFSEAVVMTGAQATEAVLKRTVAPRILHIATHGFFLQNASAVPSGEMKAGRRGISANAKIENPLLRTGLALAGANTRRGGEDDGILTALEASNTNLWGTKLVTLSACDTGLGEVKVGEGVYGLRRAFVLAGAETLVMSLWPVSDYVTRELMNNYYQGLKRGEGRGAALRRVQLAMLKRKERQHPFYWASFIQAGEWANLNGER